MTTDLRYKHTPEALEMVIDLYQKGDSTRNIAAKMGMTLGQVAGILKRTGVQRNCGGSHHSSGTPEPGTRRWAYANYLKSQSGARDALRALEDEK